MMPYLSPFFPTIMRYPTSYDHYASPNAVSAAFWAPRNGHSMTPCPAGEMRTAAQNLDEHSTVPCLLSPVGWTKELFCTRHGLLCSSMHVNTETSSWTFCIHWFQWCDAYQGEIGTIFLFWWHLWIRSTYVWCAYISGFSLDRECVLKLVFWWSLCMSFG